MPRSLIIPACLLALTGANAFAQLRAVEPGVGDIGPASRSLRVPSADLRVPRDFDRVFAAGSGDNQSLVRFDGGIAAVFPRSEYRRNARGGLSARIPAGTVFYIGALPDSLVSPALAPTRESGFRAAATPAPAIFAGARQQADSAVTTVSRKVDLRADQRIQTPAAPASIWGTPEERARRIDALVTRESTSR